VGSEPTSSGVVVPKPLKWHQEVAAFLVYVLARFLALSWRCRWDDQSGQFIPGATGPVIFCTWHNRLALSMVVYHSYVRPRRPGGLAALISASRDGGLLSRILRYFDVDAVRGSSSRRGPQSLLELTRWMERGHHVAITPDGPRGPCYSVQDGVIGLAQLTGFAIVPVSNHVSWKWCAKGWDKFQVPLPFARCDIRLGAPIFVPPDSTDEQRDELRGQLQAALMAITND